MGHKLKIRVLKVTRNPTLNALFTGVTIGAGSFLVGIGLGAAATAAASALSGFGFAEAAVGTVVGETIDRTNRRYNEQIKMFLIFLFMGYIGFLLILRFLLQSLTTQ